MIPPTSADRSRPPTPMICETPEPARSSSTLASWAPVPAAATIPTGPRRTTFAKPSPTPPSIAVPHSGPITSRPRSAPRRLRAISSSTETWSENRKTCMSRLRARWASSAAYSPGTEISARLAPSTAASERGAASTTSCDSAAWDSSRSAASSASSGPSTAMTTSAGVASTLRPSCWRLAGVPMTSSHAPTSSRARTPWATFMSRTLST